MTHAKDAQLLKPVTTGATELLTTLQASRVGVEFPRGTTLEQWLAFGESLQRADSTVMWLLGDWLAYGEGKAKQWGDKYTEALEASGYSYQTAANALCVSKALSFSNRLEKLSWSHHQEVVFGLGVDAGEKKYIKWLALALEHGLSRRELTASIKLGRVVRLAELQAEAESNQGLGTVHAVKTAFVRALNQARRLRDVDQWTPAQKTAWKRELQPIVDLYARL